jgi:subtilisin family serine protease
MNVQNSGGVAAIIYNNLDNEELYPTLGEGNSSEIVAVGTTKENGLMMLDQVDLPATVSSVVLETPLDGYEAWGGTSMATPHVSGVAALIWSANPAWTNVQIREALVETVIDLGEEGRDVMFGYGFVQAAEALAYLEGLTPPPPVEDQLVVEITSPEHAQQFTDKETVLITVRVTDGTDPVEGAAVSVSVTGTQFKAKTFTGTTGADGCVSFTYRINARKTGSGQYPIDVTATKDGYLPGTAQSIFTVS